MKSRTFFYFLLILLLSVALTFAMQNKGAEEITLDGGTRGNVFFPHKKHQDAGNECNACHDLFPQKNGVIKELIAEKKLLKKQVMNKKCINCHKQMKKLQKSSGPTRCADCHAK